MAFAEALATGLAQGLGEGFQQHFADQRREKFELKRMDKSFDMFKKQQIYSFGLQEIGKQNEALGAWEDAAKLSVNDLAFQAATKVAEPFSKGDRPQIVRDTLKNFQGMSKAELLSRAGYNKPDYSAYIDNPDYQDAIPQARIAGMADMPTMSETFQYDPRTLEKALTQAGEKMTDFDKKVKMGKQLIANRVQSVTGYRLSEDVIADLYGDGSQLQTETKGALNIDPALTRFDQLKNKVYFPVGGEIKLRSEMDKDDWAQWQAEQTGQVGPQPTEEEEMDIPAPIGAGSATYETPETAEYLAKEEEKAQMKAQQAAAKRVGEKHGKLIASYGALDELEQATQGLSDGAKQYLFGAANWKGAGAISDRVTQLAAKAGDPDAQEAAAYLSLVTNITARIKHDQYGSAQTATELKDFASQLGRPGIFQNPDTLMAQLKARKASVGRDVKSSIGQSDRDAYLAEHKDDPYAASAFGVEPEETNQTVSDSTEELRKQAAAYVDQLIAKGEYDEADREGLIQHLVKGSQQPIQ